MAQQQPQKMKTVYLGNSGTRVSELCLGAMTFNKSGAPWLGAIPAISEEASVKLINQFAAAGGNFIDTADAYSSGESEQVIGNWLSTQRRADFVIATKVANPVGPTSNDVGLSRRHIIDSLEGSLGRLKTNYVDLYQAHCWDPATPLLETLTTLNDLVRSGKVRYIGVSNNTGWQLQKAIDMARYIGLEKYITFQGEYSLMTRQPELELMPICINEGLGYLPYSPLRGGWLSGKYSRSKADPQAGSRVSTLALVGGATPTEKTWQIIDTVEDIAKETGRTIAQVALRWTLQRPTVCSTIIGVRSEAQLKDNLGATEFSLTDAQMARLNTVTQEEIYYPYNLVDRLTTMWGRTRSGVLQH